jgi:hypothetical protein
MAHAQKPDFFFRWKGWVHLNRRGRQFSRPPAAEVCSSAVVMLDTPCSAVVWRVLATHYIRQFPLYFPSHASQCVITFQLDSTLSKTFTLFVRSLSHCGRFRNGQKTLNGARAVLPFLLACYFTAIKVTNKPNLVTSMYCTASSTV